MIEIIQATLSHVQELSMTMNREDRDEVEGLYLKAHRVLWRGWKNSVIRKTLMIDGEVGAIWGVTGSPLALIGHPWMLTSKKVRGMSPHTFAKLYKSEVRGLLEVFPVNPMVPATLHPCRILYAKSSSVILLT